MTTDDLAALLAEHGGSVSSEDGHHRECAGCAVIIGLDPRTPRAGMYLAACRELVVAHQAEVIAAAGWRKADRVEWAYGSVRYPRTSYDDQPVDEALARARAEYNHCAVVRRYVTDWEEA